MLSIIMPYICIEVSPLLVIAVWLLMKLHNWPATLYYMGDLTEYCHIGSLMVSYFSKFSDVTIDLFFLMIGVIQVINLLEFLRF
jgi:hypothetical protein